MRLPRLISRSLAGFAGAALVLSPAAARACSVCMGDAENVGEAMNAAIFVMLGCIGSMLALIVAVAVSIAMRKPGEDSQSAPNLS